MVHLTPVSLKRDDRSDNIVPLLDPFQFGDHYSLVTVIRLREGTTDKWINVICTDTGYPTTEAIQITQDFYAIQYSILLLYARRISISTDE